MLHPPDEYEFFEHSRQIKKAIAWKVQNLRAHIVNYWSSVDSFYRLFGKVIDGPRQEKKIIMLTLRWILLGFSSKSFPSIPLCPRGVMAQLFVIIQGAKRCFSFTHRRLGLKYCTSSIRTDVLGITTAFDSLIPSEAYDWLGKGFPPTLFWLPSTYSCRRCL